MGLENRQENNTYQPVQDLLDQGYKRQMLFTDLDEAEQVSEQMARIKHEIGQEAEGNFSILVLPEEKSASENMLANTGPMTIREETSGRVNEVMGEDANSSGATGTNGRP
ncbi:hypothetical protein C0416_03550 [bacterium]|nr:hypothetical protein [bacterium]